jgi:hypothetical protein
MGRRCIQRLKPYSIQIILPSFMMGLRVVEPYHLRPRHWDSKCLLVI